MMITGQVNIPSKKIRTAVAITIVEPRRGLMIPCGDTCLLWESSGSTSNVSDEADLESSKGEVSVSPLSSSIILEDLRITIVDELIAK